MRGAHAWRPCVAPVPATDQGGADVRADRHRRRSPQRPGNDRRRTNSHRRRRLAIGARLGAQARGVVPRRHLRSRGRSGRSRRRRSYRRGAGGGGARSAGGGRRRRRHRRHGTAHRREAPRSRRPRGAGLPSPRSRGNRPRAGGVAGQEEAARDVRQLVWLPLRPARLAGASRRVGGGGLHRHRRGHRQLPRGRASLGRRDHLSGPRRPEPPLDRALRHQQRAHRRVDRRRRPDRAAQRRGLRLRPLQGYWSSRKEQVRSWNWQGRTYNPSIGRSGI